VQGGRGRGRSGVGAVEGEKKIAGWQRGRDSRGARRAGHARGEHAAPVEQETTTAKRGLRAGRRGGPGGTRRTAKPDGGGPPGHRGQADAAALRGGVRGGECRAGVDGGLASIFEEAWK
jgi:hypothetical protein